MTREDIAIAGWWNGLTIDERGLWMEEAGSQEPADCYRLYWSRGPVLSEAELQVLTDGHCPACKYRGFVIGPKGGASLNIECGDITCRERYNVVFVSGFAVIGHHAPSGATNIAWPSEPEPLEGPRSLPT